MADSKLIRECDGATGYQEYKSDITNYAVLAEIEHVLEHPCPDPLEEPRAAAAAAAMPTPNDPPSQPASKKLSLRASKKKRSP